MHYGDKYIVVPHFWLPGETLDLRVWRDHVPYDVWEKQGLFHVTEGNVVDYNFVRRDRRNWKREASDGGTDNSRVLPKIIELWGLNVQTAIESKKTSPD